MAGRDGNGVFTVTQPNFVAGTVIDSEEIDQNFADIATALTQSIASDGQTAITGNIPFSSNKITGLGSGTVRTDAVNLGQVQDGGYIWCGTMGGTANAGTLTPSPAITAYVAGQRFFWISSSNQNTGAMTIAISGLSAIDAQNGGAALTAGQHEADTLYMGVLDSSSTIQILKIAKDPTGALATLDTVDTAQIDDDAITLAKMAGGTDGNLITYDANGDPAYVATGTAGQVLKSNGAGAAPTMQDNDADGVPYDNATSGLTATDVQGAIDEVVQGGTISAPDVQTTTGSETELIFNIPAWATEIIITITGLDRSNTDPYVIQLRDADGTEASGYLGTWGRIAVAGVTSGIHGNYFQISGPEANTAVMSGDVRLTHHTGTTWVMSSSLSQEGSPAGTTASGRKSLSAALTGVRLTTSAGAATFDSGGVVAVRYR